MQVTIKSQIWNFDKLKIIIPYLMLLLCDSDVSFLEPPKEGHSCSETVGQSPERTREMASFRYGLEKQLGSLHNGH